MEKDIDQNHDGVFANPTFMRMVHGERSTQSLCRKRRDPLASERQETPCQINRGSLGESEVRNVHV